MTITIMRGITLHFDEVSPPRPRRERNAFLLGAAVAAFGFVAAVPEREPRVEVVERLVTAPPITITHVETVTRIETVIERVEVRSQPPRTRHLCSTPTFLAFSPRSRTRSERVTLSNPGTRPVTITRIDAQSDRARSGMRIDASACVARTLRAGEHCAIEVTLVKRIGETVRLSIASDAGEPEVVVLAAAER